MAFPFISEYGNRRLWPNTLYRHLGCGRCLVSSDCTSAHPGQHKWRSSMKEQNQHFIFCKATSPLLHLCNCVAITKSLDPEPTAEHTRLSWKFQRKFVAAQWLISILACLTVVSKGFFKFTFQHCKTFASGTPRSYSKEMGLQTHGWLSNLTYILKPGPN